jgi:L-ascorbate metabolism protein UlaG (beta-lactamase superfamily)
MLRPFFALLMMAGCCAAAEQFATSAGPVVIEPIQHASFMLRAGGKVLYIDPAQGAYDGLPKADYIFITDTHGDHLVPAIIEKLRKPETVVVTPQAAAAQVPGAIVMANGETRSFGAFKAEALPMYNIAHKAPDGSLFHPKGRGNGYVIAYGGKRFYIAGDTEGTPEMNALRNIDVAFIPMNLPYTMTPAEAAEAVRASHPAVVYPYHYRGQDPKIFAKALQGSGTDVRLREWYARP